MDLRCYHQSTPRMYTCPGAGSLTQHRGRWDSPAAESWPPQPSIWIGAVRTGLLLAWTGSGSRWR